MMAMLLCGSIAIHGQDTFNPSSPAEPDAPDIKTRLTLTATPSEGGSVSGGGTYSTGASVYVSASANSNYTFDHWEDGAGNTISTDRVFYLTKSEKAETLIAHFRFVPGSPSEPDLPSTTLYYRLGLSATQGCSVSGAGRYLAGKSISVSASVETGYNFVNWTNSKGETVSTSRSFSYTMPVDGDTLTAHCVFNPDSPSEPSDPVLRHTVTASCSDGGYYSGSTGRFLEGNSNTLTANANSGYEFAGWYLNGELYTNLRSFSYTVGKENLNFYAYFVFNPSSPGEPNMPAISLYSYYLPTVTGKPGDTVKYAINLVNTEVVKDLNIRLTFPAGVEVNPNNYVLSDKAVGYDITICEAVDTISIIEEGARLWDFTMIGGETEPATHALLTFDVYLPDTIDTGHRHQVKINQISMTMADGTPVTARTRNGLLSIFKLGDVSGDNSVNEVDAQQILDVSAGIMPLSDLEVPEMIDVPGGNAAALEVNAQIVLDYSVAKDKPW